MLFAGMLALVGAGVLFWRAADTAVSREATRDARRRHLAGSALLLAALMAALSVLPGAIAVLAWISAVMACGATVVSAGPQALSDERLAVLAGTGGMALVGLRWLLA